MRALPRPPFFCLSCLTLLLLAGFAPVSAADEIESKRIHFTAYDEVELSGTFYRSTPASGERDKDAVVLLLHDFRHAKGGGSKEDGWNQLAGELQKKGYAVFSFDFRGFGNSKAVAPKFWMHPHNQRLIRGAAKRPATIDQKDFMAGYYPALVNDIAAARAYLSVLNDAGEVNSSNIIVIGAGQGATLGALWMASECRRQRDPASDRLSDGRLPDWTNPLKSFDDPESNDLAAAVWLTISPTLEGRILGKPLTSALVDCASPKRAKIPMYFLYGNRDPKAEELATFHLKAIAMENGKESEQTIAKKKAIPGVGELAGSKMLGSRFRTAEYTVDYLSRVLENRGTRVRKARDDQKFAFCWTMPWPTAKSVRRILAKLPAEPVTRIIPPEVLGLSR